MHNVSRDLRGFEWRGRARSQELRVKGAGRQHLPAVIAAACGVFLLGAGERVAAQEVPPGCSFAGAGASVTRFPPTNVVHGQELCYRVQYSNGITGVNCEIRNFSADLFLPDGTTVPVFSGVTIQSGEAVICPSADPRCATPSNCGIAGQEGYSYTVRHVDEVDSFSGCPPVPVAGTGRVVAYTQGLGDSLTAPPDAAAACATANNIVPHACCGLCPDECTDVVSAGDCPSPGSFIPNRTCNEDPCTPLDCNDDNACTDDRCDSENGCIHEDNSARCNDMDVCTDDSCDPIVGCLNEDNSARCDDMNVCTEDSCDPVAGCINEDNSARCNDMDVCTDDSCDPIVGCLNEDNSTRCDDMNACTDDSCDPVAGCLNEDNSARCDDGDECTADSCDPMDGCVNVPIEPPPPGCGGDFAGCTPGFWKQPHHEQYWVDYDPDDIYDDVFGVTAFGPTFTLFDALEQGGGGAIALGRHSVAALLNSTQRDVNYFYSTQEIIDLVQMAYDTGDFNGIKNQLAEENERGCTVVKQPRAAGRASLRD